MIDPSFDPVRESRDRPRVRVNQFGYAVDNPITATVLCDRGGPVGVDLVDEAGRTIRRGATQPCPVDPTSGLPVHRIRLDGVDAPRDPVRLAVDGALSHPFAIAVDPYGPLAGDALRFFRLMRSGYAWNDAEDPGYGAPAGHVGVAPNRGDTSVPAWTGPDSARLYPGWCCPGRFDLRGGWYDAGDYGRYVTSGAIAVWQLLSTIELLGDGPAADDLARRVRAEARWELDWLLRMQVPRGTPLSGMVFHRVHGTEWSPLPGRPHEDPTTRVVHRPSTPATLAFAAATAQAARLLRTTDPSYSATLLGASRTAFRAADRNAPLPAPDDRAQHGGGAYPDADADDDRYWAAAELWLATGESAYLDRVLASPCHGAPVFDDAGYDYDAVAAPARLDLAVHGRALPGHPAVVDEVVHAADRFLGLAAEQPWGQPYAPGSGWDWGSNGRILNNLVVIATAARLDGAARFRSAVLEGMDYLLGRNGLGQSYVTGFGTDATRRPRTRQFGFPLDPALPHPPPGALAGGPNSRPSPDFPYDDRLRGLPPQLCYLDEPTSEQTNDVCIRWNAPLVWVSAFLTGERGGL